MADVFNGRVQSLVDLDLLIGGDLASAHDKIEKLYLTDKKLTDGTGAGKSQIFYADEFTIAVGATALANFLYLPRTLGGHLVFTKLKYLAVKITTATTAHKAKLYAGGGGFDELMNRILGREDAGTDAINHIILPADGLFVYESWTDGIVIESGFEELYVTHIAGAGSITGRIIAIGEGSLNRG